MKRAMVFLAVLAVSGVAVACGSSGGSGSSGSGSASGSAASESEKDKFPSNEANTVVQVEAVEYAYKLSVPQAVGPKVYFIVKNAGTIQHEFEILGPDGKAVDEIPAFDKDTTKNLAVELKPGTYTFQCLLKTGDKTHASLGMTTKYTVT